MTDKPETRDWKEELRSLWQVTRENQGKYAKVKSFIENLLAEREGELMKTLDGLKEVYRSDGENHLEGDEKDHADSERNEVLDEVLSLLNKQPPK